MGIKNQSLSWLLGRLYLHVMIMVLIDANHRIKKVDNFMILHFN